MINLELFFNGEVADIDEVDTIAATYSLNTLGKIKTRQGARTNQYVLPFTPRNKRLFENSELINNSTNIPYVLMEHYALIEGAEVFSGFAVVESAEKGYEINAFGSNSEFFSLIKDRSIRDLDLSIWNHIRNDINIRASWLFTTGYTYAFIDYGKYGTLPSEFDDANPDEIMKHDLYPSVFMKTIIEKISEEAGYRLSGKVLSNPEFTQKLIPHSYDKPGKEVDYGIKGTRLPSAPPPNGADPGIVTFDLTFNEADGWDDTLSGYVSPLSQIVSIRMDLRYTVPPMFSELRIYVFKRPAGNTSTNPHYNQDGGVLISLLKKAGAVSEEITTIDDVTLLRGETLYVAIYNTGGAGVLVGFNEFVISTTQVLNTFNQEWDVAANLPDIKQGKFFLEFMMQFNLIPNTNFTDGVIDLVYFDDIESKPIVDWSLKIDESERPKTYFKFNDYSQSNRLTYKTDDVITDGRHYDFLINNKTLKPSDTEFESQFYLPTDEFIYSGLQKVMNTKSLVLKNEYVWRGKWKSTTAYAENDVVYHPQGSWHIATVNNTNKDPSDASLTEWKFAAEASVWDIKKRNVTGLLKGGIAIPIQFDDGVFTISRYVTSEKLDWAYIWETYYKSFEGILDRTKIMEILMKLNYADINQLDQTRPIYIREYNQKFYLDEVTQFKFNEADSTVCRLIRL